MIVYWIVLGVLSLPFFDNLDLSSSVVNGVSTVLSYLYTLDGFLNVKLLFSLLISFLGLLFLGLITHVIISLIRR